MCFSPPGLILKTFSKGKKIIFCIQDWNIARLPEIQCPQNFLSKMTRQASLCLFEIPHFKKYSERFQAVFREFLNSYAK